MSAWIPAGCQPIDRVRARGIIRVLVEILDESAVGPAVKRADDRCAGRERRKKHSESERTNSVTPDDVDEIVKTHVSLPLGSVIPTTQC